MREFQDGRLVQRARDAGLLPLMNNSASSFRSFFRAIGQQGISWMVDWGYYGFESKSFIAKIKENIAKR